MSQIQEKRNVLLTAFMLNRCLCCGAPLGKFRMRLPKGAQKWVDAQHCWKCNTFYLLCNQKNVDLMRVNTESIDAIALQRHVREYNRYVSLRHETAAASMAFSFLLINRTDAMIYTITTDYRLRNPGRRIIHYREPEARKIMTASFFGDGSISINGSDYAVQIYENRYDYQYSLRVIFPDDEICIGKGNNGGYYTPGGSKPMIALLYCAKTQCLEAASVTYDETEGVYLMDSTVYKSLVAQYGFPICDYVSRNRNGYSELNEESKLHILGYNVGDSEGMSDAQRQSLLAELVELGFLQVYEIVNHLDFLIRLNGGRSQKSIQRWNADKEFIMNYRIDQARFALFDRIRTSRRSYSLR